MRGEIGPSPSSKPTRHPRAPLGMPGTRGAGGTGPGRRGPWRALQQGDPHLAPPTGPGCGVRLLGRPGAGFLGGRAGLLT